MLRLSRAVLCIVFLPCCQTPSGVDAGAGEGVGRRGMVDSGVAGHVLDGGVDAGAVDPCGSCPRGSVCGQDGCLFLCGECRQDTDCGKFTCSSRAFCSAPLSDCGPNSERSARLDIEYRSDRCSPRVGDCSISVAVEPVNALLRTTFVASDAGLAMSQQLSPSDLVMIDAARFSCVDAGYWDEYPLGCVAHDWHVSVSVQHPSLRTTTFTLYRGQARRPPLAVDDALDVLLLRAVESLVDAGVL